MSCPKIVLDRSNLSPRPKSLSRRSSPALSPDITDLSQWSSPRLHEDWRINFDRQIHDLDHYDEEGKPKPTARQDTGNSDQRSVKKSQSLDATAHGESLYEAVPLDVQREFSIMRGWTMAQNADQKIWFEKEFSELKMLHLRVLDVLHDIRVTCNINQEKQPNSIRKQAAARTESALVAAQCIGNAQAVSWTEGASSERKEGDMAPFIHSTSSAIGGLHKDKKKNMQIKSPMDIEDAKSLEHSSIVLHADESPNRIENTSSLVPPTELSSRSSHVDVQLWTEKMLLDYEAGIKQGLEQLAVKLAEEIRVLLAQSSSLSVLIDPTSSQTCDRRHQQSNNRGLIQQTSAPQDQRVHTSESGMNVYKEKIADAIDDEQEDRRILNGVKDGTILDGVGLNSVRAKISEVRSTKNNELHQQFLHRFVVSRNFNIACLAIVLLNALWLGYECDQKSAAEHGWISAVTLTFNIWFMVELAIRIAGLQQDFIFGPDWMWNLVDTFCVVISIFIIHRIPDFFSTSVNVSVLRILRLCKLIKAVRLMRMLKMIRSLRVILTTVFFTLGSLFWSFVAILFIAYIFAILMIQALRLYEEGGVQFGRATTDNFSSVYMSILTLFSVITGGQDWKEIALDMRTNGGYVVQYLLILWIFFALFGLVNIVVAVFCTKAIEAEESQRDLRLEKEEEHRTERVSDLMDVFNMIDTESRGSITWHQFREFAHDRNGSDILESNGLLLIALEPLWEMMAECSDGEVDMSAFVMGFMRLSHHHIHSDLLLISQALRHLRIELREFADKRRYIATI